MMDTISAMATSSSGGKRKSSSSSWPIGFFLSVLLPISIAVGVVLYRLDPFDPAPFPEHEFFQEAGAVAQPRRVNGRMMQGAEFVGNGQLRLPEDIVYDPSLGVMYTGCVDGWINRVTVNESASDSAVEKWVNTGGRPLGLALNHQNHELIVADAVKGLLKITKDKEVILLSDEAEGQKFGLTDGVDVAKDGTIYFTDASSKYGLENHLRDYCEGRPYGRLLSFDPTTGLTKVLRRRLYFPNGVAVSPDQTSVIFCETPLKRCRRYRMEGDDGNGTIERFIDNLPGLPDNIRYDGEGHYWIAIFALQDVAGRIFGIIGGVSRGFSQMEALKTASDRAQLAEAELAETRRKIASLEDDAKLHRRQQSLLHDRLLRMEERMRTSVQIADMAPVLEGKYWEGIHICRRVLQLIHPRFPSAILDSRNASAVTAEDLYGVAGRPFPRSSQPEHPRDLFSPGPSGSQDVAAASEPHGDQPQEPSQ